MNKRQKEVLQAQLNSEEEVIARLKSTYEQALGDCEAKIQELSMRADLEPEHIQTIIYQKQYQEAIKAQLEGALANLQSNSYATVSDYLTRSYQEGYLGTMYDLQGRGIPLVMPIDQEQVAQAIQLNTKLSTSLYNRMGEDVKVLKKAVRQEVSRGIAQGMTWSQVASNLAGNMKHTPFQKAYNNSIRIARTEGHRIQNNATLDAQKSAKDRGADIVKRWNAVLDGKTRDVHRELDGQVREIGEMFEAAGYKVEAPGMFGDPSQDCNCRCYLEQVPRWDLEGGMTKMDNFSKRIVAFETPDDYEEWKKAYWSDENIAYMQHVTAMEKKYGKNFETVLNSMTDKEYERYKRLLDDNPMYKTEKPLVGHHGLDKTEEFKGKYLKGADEESAEYFGLDKTNDFDEYKSKFLKADKVMNAPEINDTTIVKSQDDFKDILNNSKGEAAHVTRMSMYSEYTEYVENDKISAPFQYSVTNDVIYYNSKAPNFELYDTNYVQAHELSHRMDMLQYESYKNKDFINAIDTCRKRIMNNAQEIQTWFDESGKYENDFAISDIISALSSNSIEVPIGHNNDYWSDPNNVALEIFANISSIDVIGNSSKAEFKSALKELYESYKEIVK